jgi:hypothetical protein
MLEVLSSAQRSQRFDAKKSGNMDRRRNLGLAAGCLWLVLVSITFADWSLFVVRSIGASILLAAISLIAAVLIVVSVAMLRTVYHLRDETPPRPSEARRLGRAFGLIAGMEGLVITGVTLACVFWHHTAFIVPLDLTIVGLHFLPLAKLFSVPRYYITGCLFCIVPIATMLLVPRDQRIGNALSWIVLPSVGCAMVAFGTAWAGLSEVNQFIHSSRMAPS